MTFRKKIITVNSPKGGVGKSCLIKQLTYQLSLQKFANGDLKILVVDADLEFGDICSIFKINPINNISNWIAEIEYNIKNGIDRTNYPELEFKNRFVTTLNKNIDILSAPIRHKKVKEFNIRAIDIIFDNLKKFNYDVILIDTGNNSYDYTIKSILLSDEIYSLITLDMTTLKRMVTFNEILKNGGFDLNKINYILNFCTKEEFENIYDFGIEDSLKKEVKFYLPFNDEIRIKNNLSGDFLNKKTEYYQQVDNIVQHILST